MFPTIVAEVRDGQLHPLEPTALPEGMRVLVTLLGDDEEQSWQIASQKSLEMIWANDEDDVYAQLLQK